jgi:uncharacterized protein DUF4262
MSINGLDPPATKRPRVNPNTLCGQRTMSENTCNHDLSTASRKVIHDVNTFGWHVIKVSPSGVKPGWAFSIGLYQSFKHAEVAMFGLDLTTMHQVINLIGNSVREGKSYTPGSESAEFLEGYRCSFRSVDPVWFPQVLGYAVWFYGGVDFPVLQVIWPDKQHHYPWELEFELSLLDQQPTGHRSAGG